MTWDAWLLTSLVVVVFIPIVVCMMADARASSSRQRCSHSSGRFITLDGRRIDHGMSVGDPVRHRRDRQPVRSR